MSVTNMAIFHVLDFQMLVVTRVGLCSTLNWKNVANWAGVDGRKCHFGNASCDSAWIGVGFFLFRLCLGGLGVSNHRREGFALSFARNFFLSQ